MRLALRRRRILVAARALAGRTRRPALLSQLWVALRPFALDTLALPARGRLAGPSPWSLLLTVALCSLAVHPAPLPIRRRPARLALRGLILRIRPPRRRTLRLAVVAGVAGTGGGGRGG